MAKKNMSPTKVPMPEQAADVRNKNFDEVALGYTAEMAVEEAGRCLGCKNRPCVGGCPVNVPIPDFIAKVAEGDFEAAYQIISGENSLPAICGRVCPQENQCEGKCVRGIKGEPVGIGRLERFVADYHMEHAEPVDAKIEKNGHFHSVDVGAGNPGIKGTYTQLSDKSVRINCKNDEDFDPYWKKMPRVAKIKVKVVSGRELRFTYKNGRKKSTLVFRKQ